jgi:hypothetical protein
MKRPNRTALIVALIREFPDAEPMTDGEFINATWETSQGEKLRAWASQGLTIRPHLFYRLPSGEVGMRTGIEGSDYASFGSVKLTAKLK